MNKVTSKLTKAVCVVICLISCMCLFTACGTESIDGVWVLSKQVLADGTVVTGDQIERAESYTIANGMATYTCEAAEEGMDPISFILTVVETGKNTYDFNITGDVNFVSVEIKGKNLVYSFTDESGTMTFYFTKQKKSNKLQG